MATTTEQRARPKWGDADASDAYDALPAQEVQTEERPDGSIVRTVTDYRTNAQGQRVKVVKRYHVFKTQQRINPAVEQRKQWRKFGECADVGPGPERGVTNIGDEAILELTRRADTDETVASAASSKAASSNLGIVCRTCKGDHWTHRCPFAGRLFATPDMASAAAAAEVAAPLTASSGALGDGGNKYVVPANRAGSSSRLGDMMAGPGRREETATVRVTNLSEETKESDLQELFRKFGPISRVYLAKDKQSGLSKGFAFINFMRREDAAKAIDKLSGKFGYDHLILHIEWAKPSTSDAPSKRV